MAEAENPPVKASWGIGTYSDGSGPKATVEYDTTSEYTPGCVWLYHGDGGGSQWVAFDAEDIPAITEAMNRAASMLLSRKESSNVG